MAKKKVSRTTLLIIVVATIFLFTNLVKPICFGEMCVGREGAAAKVLYIRQIEQQEQQVQQLTGLSGIQVLVGITLLTVVFMRK